MDSYKLNRTLKTFVEGLIQEDEDEITALEAKIDLVIAYVLGIDGAATGGLLGVEDSLSYRVNEIERHNHHWERWVGLASSPSGETHVADSISAATAPEPFQIDAGNNDWGAWVQLLGSDDTPVIAGSVKYDFHRIAVVDIEHAYHYFFQVAFGTSAAAALTAGTYSEMVYEPDAANTGEAPIDVQTRRQDAGTKAWMRCKCPGQNTAAIDFFVGLHEYEG